MKHRLTPFQQSALDFSRHIALTANAGSGKTFVLAKRYLEIALQKNVLLKNIVAITFTEKAAGELFNKINQEVDNRLAIEKDNSKYRKLIKIKDSLVSANISTIHSFCINILKEFSPAAGLDANFIPIDARTSGEIIYNAIELLFKNLESGSSVSEHFKKIFRVFGSRERTIEQLKHLVNNRRNYTSELISLYQKDDTEIAKHNMEIFSHYFEIIFIERIKKLITSLLAIVNNAIEVKSNNNLIKLKEFSEKILKSDEILFKISVINDLKETMLTKGGTLRKRGLLPQDLVDEYDKDIDEIVNLLNELSELNVTDDFEVVEKTAVSFSKSLSIVLSELIQLYEELKYSKTALDFEDILLYTREILEQDEVRDALKEKYKFIMIDEYQDTNELQYQIFLPILDSLNRGNLFIVGDEKQSIYMFRGAEIDVFEKTKEDILRSADSETVLFLPHSFRLSPGIAAFVNVLFNKLFDNPNRIFNEVNSNDLISTRSDDNDSSIEIIIKKDDSTFSEAELLCNKILQLQRDGEELNTIAVLSNKRKSLSEVEQTLKDYGIPYSIAGGRGFYQQQIVNDLYNYLSFLIDPSNDKALIGILRSPFYFLSDTELFQISKHDGVSFFEKYTNSIGELKHLNEKLEMLKRHLTILNTVKISELFRIVLNETCYWSIIASRNYSEQDLANIEKMIAISAEFAKKPFISSSDFLEFFDSAVRELEDESQAEVTGGQKGVNLMTIHQSKGLEFDSVFLYKCNQKPNYDVVKAGSVLLDRKFGLLAKVPKADNFFEGLHSPLNVKLFNYISQKRNLAEYKRLLYVALTRAKDNLFITADFPDEKIIPNSFFEMIINSVGIDIDSEEHLLSSKLKFMIERSGSYDIVEKETQLKIDIKDTCEKIELEQKIEKVKEVPRKIMLHEVKDKTKYEIFSASKMAIFNQCPVKYHLTYNLGYGKLQNQLGKIVEDSTLKNNEDDIGELPPNIKGSLIHKILEHNVSLDSLKTFIKSAIPTIAGRNVLLNDNYIDEIINDIKVYYDSEVYKSIQESKNVQSEYEIYLKHYENYLYGIIDKIILNEDEIVIVDFKSDDLSKEEINSKCKRYKIQLAFYAFLASKHFGKKRKITSKLIFIKFPDDYISAVYSQKDFEEINSNIKYSINRIQESIYNPNLSHCVECHFTNEEKRCVY